MSVICLYLIFDKIVVGLDWNGKEVGLSFDDASKGRNGCRNNHQYWFNTTF